MSTAKRNEKGTFKFDLVTPDRVVASGEVSQVLMPAYNGEIGILPSHSSMITKIVPGLLTIYSPKGDVAKMFVASGFADVNEFRCSLLVESAEELSSLKLEELEVELVELKGRYKALKGKIENYESVMQKIFITEAKIRLLKGKSSD